MSVSLVVALALVVPAGAAEVVVFEDGRSVRVREVAPRGETARLVLDDGSQIDVPVGRIASWSTVAEPPPTTPAADACRSAESDSILRVEARLEAGEAWREAAGPYAEAIATAADRYGLSRALLAAVAQVESGFDPHAVSRRGAQGLMQLMPATGRRFGVTDPFDAGQSIEAGARYLRWLLDRFGGRFDLALAGYNAGEGAVDRYEAIPPYRETLGYVVKVLSRTTAGMTKQGP